MKVIILDYDTKKEIGIFSCEGEKSSLKLSSCLSEIDKRQREEDVLKLGRVGFLEREGFSLGISEYITSGTVSSTIEIKDLSKISDVHNLDIKSIDELSKSYPKTLKFREYDNSKTDTGKRIIAIGYKEGLVLNTGKFLEGIISLYSKKPAYFIKFSSSRIHCGSVSDAKLFKTPTEVTRYVRKFRDYFEYVVKNHGYSLSIEYANNLFKSDIERLPEKKLAKWNEQMQELKDLIDDINNVPDDVEENNFPEEVTPEIMREEAISRMKNLKLMDEVISNFKNGKLMMSEFAGILYDLNDEAKEAVEKVKEYGYLPYHIIRTHTEFGELYDVLFVSDNTESWQYERRNKRYKDMYSYCYNATVPDFSSTGTIIVESLNGGVKREG